MVKYINLIGSKYGMLTAIGEITKRHNGRQRYYVKCLCECGNETIVEKSHVKSGQTRSCGCLQKEMRKNLGSKFKKAQGVASLNERYGSYKKSALKRGYDFKLTIKEFEEIITKPCIYCGDKKRPHFNRESTNGNFEYTGIDRYDNNKGYVIGNVVPCCSACNRIKRDMDIETFEKKLETILKNKNVWKRTE